MQNDNSKIKVSKTQKDSLIDGGFLQSEHWGRFQQALGRKVEVVEAGGFRAQMIFHELPAVGGYFFVPRGPLMKISIRQLADKFQISNKNQSSNSKKQNTLQMMMGVAGKNSVGWIRVEPQTENDLNVVKKELGDKYKILKSKKNHEPSQTLMVDLTKSEDEILADMKQKTRYNIRLAEKRGVAVFESRKEESVKKFIELTKETAKRDGIVPHPDEYYQKMIETIPGDVLKLYFAKFEDKAISTIMVSFFGAVATYLHGASSNERRNVMAPFALQWRAMRDARQLGCNKYDLNGTKLSAERRMQNAECETQKEKESKHQSSTCLPVGKVINHQSDKWVPEKGDWEGITKFKQGFCPKNDPVEFPGCWDIIIDAKKYKLYGLLQGMKDLAHKLRG